MQEQVVHEMIDGVLTVRTELVEAKFVPSEPVISLQTESFAISSFAAKSHSKITSDLQTDLDSGVDLIKVAIMLPKIDMWPNGWPDPKKYPTSEQITQRNDERKSVAQIMQEPIITLLENNSVEIIDISLRSNYVVANVPASLVSNLEQLNAVESIDTVDKQITSFIAESRHFTGVEQIKFWGFDGSNTRIGIIDTGLDIVDGTYDDASNTADVVHDDLNDLDDIDTNNDPKLAKIIDIHIGDSDGDDPDDCNGHGTSVAGIASGTGQQNPAHSGYAPKSQLNIYKTNIDCTRNHDTLAVVSAINLAVADGVDVLNLSLGGSGAKDGSDILSRTIDDAYDSGVAVIVAAGNEPFNTQPAVSGTISFPGTAHKALTVGSVSGVDGTTWLDYSQWGPTSDGRIKPEIVAPVNPFTSTDLDNSYDDALSGTSFAAPQVTGAIADLHEAYDQNNISLEPGRMYAVLLSQATGDATGTDGGIRMGDQVGAGTLGMRYNTLETHSSFIDFTTVPGSLTVPITVPSNAEKLTASLWWGEDVDDVHNNVDLELYRGSTLVTSSTSSEPVTERIILENPVPGTSSYDLVIDGTNITNPPQEVWYSYTFTLPNTVPNANSQSVDVGTGFTEIQLTGSDIDREQLIFTIEDQPDHYAFNPSPLLVTSTSTTTATVTYAPTFGFTGTDSFTFRISDGLDESSLATVSISIDPSLTTTEIINANIDYVNDEIQIQFDTKIDTDLVVADFDIIATLDDTSTVPLILSDVENFGVASAFRNLEISGELPSNMVHLFIDVLNTNLVDENGNPISDVIPFDEDVDPEDTGGGGGPNVRPNADAGNNQQVNAGDLVTLDGFGSSDPDGDVLTYSWSQTDSSGHTVTLSDDTAVSPAFTAPPVTVYTQLTFELVVTEQTPEALFDENSVSIFVAPLSQSRDPDSFIPHPSPDSFSRFGELAETEGDKILTSTGSATFVSAMSTSTQELLSASELESNLQSLSTNSDITLQPIDLEIINNDNSLEAVFDDGTTYSITETIILDGTQSFDAIISAYNSEVTSQSTSNLDIIALVDEDNNRVYLIDPVTSQALAFSFYWGFAYLYDFNNPTPLNTIQGPGSLSSDYGEDALAMFDQNSVAVSDTRYQYTDPNASTSGLVHVYDDMPSGLITDPDHFVENPERASGDRFGFRMTNVGTDKIAVSGNSMTNVYLFSKDGSTQINSYPNPISPSSNFSPQSMDSLDNDKFVVGFSNKAYVFSDSSQNPILTIDAPLGSSGFGGSVAGNPSQNWILVGAPSTTVNSNSGAGTVYLFDGTTGELIHTIPNPESGTSDQFGKFVSFVKNKIIVGAPDDDPSGISNAGSVYLFSPVDGSLLESINNDRTDEHFGTFASGVNSGNSIVVSAPEFDGTFTDEGRIFIYSNLNNIPIANADVNPSQIESGGLVTFDGSASSDPDGDILTYSWSQTDSSGHTVTLSDDTVVSPTFTAPPVASDTTLSFELIVNDGTVDSVASTVDVLVVVSNSPPVAVDDNATVNEAESTNVNVASNDSDSDGTLDLTSINILFSPAHGTASANIDGTVTYIHDGSESTTDTFTYVIDDDQGDSSNVATVSVNITPVNDPPILNLIGNHVINEQTLLTFTATATDVDVPSQVLTFSLTNSPPSGSTIDPSTGIFSWTPSFSQVGIHAFDVTVSDSVVSTSESIIVTVLNINDSPVAVDDSQSTQEDTPVTVSVLDNDSDVDGDSLVVDSVTQGTNGSVSTDGTTVTYIPSLDFNGADSFTYTVSDGNGGTDTALVTINVNTDNDSPVAVDDSQSTQEDTPVTVSVLDNDSDVDGDSLVVDSVTQGTNGSVSTDGTTVTYTPSLNFNGADSFTYTISDGNGGTDTATVSVTVDPVNDAPVANDDSALTPEDTPVTVSVLDNDSDVEGDILAIDSVTQGTNGSVSTDGTTVTYTPSLNFNGADSFTYTVSDNDGASVSATVSVTVDPVNDAPVANDDSALTPEDTPVTVSVLDNDSDVEGDILAIDSVTQGTNGSVSTDGTTVTYTPSLNFNGADSFTYTVSDNDGASVSATVSVTVDPVNDTPIVLLTSPSDGSNFSIDELVDFVGTATDVEDGDLTSTLIWTSSKDGQIGTGGLFTLSNLSEGTHVITISASDSQGAGSTDSVTILIQSDPNLELYCNDLTIVELEALAAEGTFNLIDNRGGVSTLLRGTNGDDLIFTSDFGDTIKARNGNDCVIGGTGDDDVRGGNGNDQIFGQGGNDHLRGNNGADMISGNDGDDTIHGGRGNDNLSGGQGDDRVHGHLGNDEIAGDIGNDDLRGGKGNDVINGGDGNDIIKGHRGNDLIDGGDGDDELRGGKNNDVIFGASGNDVIRGGQGDDDVQAGDGNDDIRGNKGNDNLQGQNGNDTIHGGHGNDVILGGDGIDSCHDNKGNNSIDCENITPMQDDSTNEDKEDDFGENDKDW